MTARFTVRSEVDFIALAPVVLGFQPTHSLVMMTVDSFHARIDIPDESNIGQCIEALLMPVLKHNVGRVAFVLFDSDGNEALKTALIEHFMNADIVILAALEVGDGKYRRFDGEWQPLDIETHPMVLEAQYLDVAPKHRSRDELVAYVKPGSETWREGVSDSVELLQYTGIDNSISALTPENARDQVKLWTMALRGCEAGSELVPDIAVVLAFSAWLSGDGALAWVALDLADHTSNWHFLLSTALEQAVPPSAWSEVVNRDA